MYRGFTDYWTDFGNYFDQVYISGSIAMAYVHSSDPYGILGKCLMILVVMSAIRRTFNMLKIFRDLSPIVTMLSNVIFQLRIFMTFFLILTVLFSLMYDVIGIGNVRLKGTKFSEEFGIEDEKGEIQWSEEAPNSEYIKVGLFFGNFFQTLRVALGDFPIIDSSRFLNFSENVMFWIIWFFNVVITAIIFLNFIVAEASESYNQVSEQLENIIWQQRAEMASEAESLWPSCLKKENGFPQYIIIRKVEQ